MKISSAGIVIFSALALGGCAGMLAGPAPLTTLPQTLDSMRQHEIETDFPGYERYFTERGKGWLAAQLTQGLVWEAYEEDHDQTMGQDASDMLDRYGLSHMGAQMPAWITEVGKTKAWERLAALLGNRYAQFLKDYHVLHPILVFPANFQVTAQAPAAGGILVSLTDPNNRIFTLKLRFVHKGNDWVCDGEPEQP